MPIANIYGTVTVILNDTDFPLSLFQFLFKPHFYLVYLSTPPQKKDKDYDAKNGFYFFSGYLVTEGGNLLPQKLH
jgi:hypothetical protein